MTIPGAQTTAATERHIPDVRIGQPAPTGQPVPSGS